MSPYNRILLATISDTHGGNSLGLRMPWTKLQSGDIEQEKNLNECQIYLYGIYESARQKIIEIAGNDEIILLHGGDVCQGNKYTDDRETGTIADDILIARDNMLPLVSLPNVKTVRFAKGTAAHSFGNGSAEILVAELLSQQFPDKNIRAVYHGWLEHKESGFTVDYAHHGPTAGRRIYLKGNEARYYLRDIMMNEISVSNRPCNLYLRDHVHSYCKEILFIDDREVEYESMLVIIPSMCMMGNYGVQVSKSSFLITNGIALFEIINGKIFNVYRFFQTQDIRTKEII